MALKYYSRDRSDETQRPLNSDRQHRNGLDSLKRVC